MEVTSKELISDSLATAYELRKRDIDQSIELTSTALDLSSEIDDKALIGACLNQLALFSMIRSDHDKSIVLSKEAIKIFEELKDDKGIANAKYNIASVYYKTDNLHSGLMNLIDCLEVYTRFEDHHNKSRVLKALGTIYEHFGDEARAIKAYKESILSSRIVNEKNLESNALNPLSGIYLNHGDIDKAMEVIEKSIKMKKETEDIRGLAFALYGRGKVFTSMLEFEKAEKDFNDSMEIHIEMGEQLGLGMARHKMGYLYMIWQRMEEAEKYLKAALEFGKKWNISLINFKCNHLLYQIAKEEGNTTKALRYLENYVVEKEAVINRQTLKVIENYRTISRMENLERENRIEQEFADLEI